MLDASDELTASDDEIASIQAKLDSAKTARAAARAKVVADAKARGEPAPEPARDGRFSDEVLDGYRWDIKTYAWVAFAGTDRTESVPPGFVHHGDGSAESPHDIRPEHRW